MGNRKRAIDRKRAIGCPIDREGFMRDLPYIVVGNEYESFAQHDYVLTYRDFELLPKDRPISVILGQGLSLAQRETISTAQFVRTRDDAHYLKCPRKLTHKVVEENVLISEPFELAPSVYRSYLMLATAADRLSDKVNGQHLSGMLLIEAARQAGTAAIEKHFLAKDERRWQLSWTRCDTHFLEQAYPVPTELHVHVPHVENFAELTQLPMVLPIEIMQVGEKITDVRMELRLLARTLADKLEKRRAKRATDALQSAMRSQ